MNVLNISIALCLFTLSSFSTSTASRADGFEIGGWIEAHHERPHGAPALNNYETNTLASFSVGDFAIGLGAYRSASRQVKAGASWNIFNRDPYWLLNFRSVTATYGEIYGAGNLFPDDYFFRDETTDISGGMLRFDVEIGQHHVAASYDTDASNREIQLGYAGNFGGVSIASGYNSRRSDFGHFVAYDAGRLGYQVAYYHDTNCVINACIVAGGTVDFDVTDRLNVSGSYAMTPNLSDPTHSITLAALYGLGSSSFRVRWVRDHIGNGNYADIGILIPFGKTPPAMMQRHIPRNYLVRNGY